MKCISFLVMINIFCMPLNKSNETETSNLYQQSLCQHLSTIDIDTVYVIKCFDIELPSKIKNYQIIDISDNPKSFLRDKEKLYAIKLMPIEIYKGNVEIGLIDYILEEKDGKVMMGNAGNETFVYRYNKKTQAYKLIEKK